MVKLAQVLLLATVLPAYTAERTFDFFGLKEGEVPAGFRSMVTGQGAAPQWKIVTDEVPLVVAPLSEKAPIDRRRPVLAQTSADKSESRAPLLVFDAEPFVDFTFTARMKIVSGEVEQMAGLAFRFQNESNYYYARLSAKGKNVSFFRYVDGELIGPLTASAPINLGEWNTLAVECRGLKLRLVLNDTEVLPWSEPSYVPFPDGSSRGVFGSGKVGFWTKADTVAHFVDAKVIYTPREPFAQTLVRETLKKHPRLLGVKVFAKRGETGTQIIASDKLAEIGEAGGQVERDCLENGGTYSGRGKEEAHVTMPLRDRNGEIVGAVRLVMTTFLGQTEKNLLSRALPIVKSMEEQIVSAKEMQE